MGDERLAKQVYESDVSRTRRRGKPRKCWMNGVEQILERKSLSIQEAKVSIQERIAWCSICTGD